MGGSTPAAPRPGAPVADEDGRLVGIVFARSSGKRGQAWAVQASAVSQLIGGAPAGRRR